MMADFELPVTRYATSGDVNIAYQTMGTGPVDIIMVPGFISHVEFMHELAGYTAFLRRLSPVARVVTFDKRGQGLSDRISGAPSLEQRMDDVCAVMDAIGSRRAVIGGRVASGASAHQNPNGYQSTGLWACRQVRAGRARETVSEFHQSSTRTGVPSLAA